MSLARCGALYGESLSNVLIRLIVMKLPRGYQLPALPTAFLLPCGAPRFEVGLPGRLAPPTGHESLTVSWWPAEFIPKKHYDWKSKQEVRRMNLFRRRTIPRGALIHQSAYERGAAYSGRLPSDAVVV
jgi:hypothetical protein